ncbi:NAD(P)H-dependent oxidoreductase [Humibacter sp. RRB41]|uniref:NAD(P)H-dependent oxidoreductase n=1 Tax=Humibacter sp. RRB41 TaxID=2919946 RepID=UPI00242F1DA3|nr:NAD(P)H-dependent oxidoreductase [Humibacter sp. RRB41]
MIVGHPDIAHSRVSAALTRRVLSEPSVDVRILDALYSDGRIDVPAEQAALTSADDIVLLYPTHWYSTPALLKRWMDEVLQRGWAYGTGGSGALAGKSLRVATTTGGSKEAYRPGELHSFEYDAILAPMKATAHRLGMRWNEPFLIQGVREIDDRELADLASAFVEVVGERDGQTVSAGMAA